MSKKILIVEDEPDFITAITVLLEAEGYEVLVANNGREGLAKAKSTAVDLIILDVMMPQMDGYKLCRMLKFDKRHKDIPIVMLTAKAQEEDKLTGEECGADAYLLKSRSPDEILAKIKELLER